MILHISEQVAPLYLCKRIVELGAPDETHHVWYQGLGDTWPVERKHYDEMLRRGAEPGPDTCPAYTAPELLAIMPNQAANIMQHLGGFTVEDADAGRDSEVYATGLAEALAKLFIHLREAEALK